MEAQQEPAHQPPPPLNRATSSLGVGLAIMPSASRDGDNSSTNNSANGMAMMMASAAAASGQQQQQFSMLSSNGGGSSHGSAQATGIYPQLDAQAIVENAKRALDAAGGGGALGQPFRRMAPPNEDMLWMPQHRPLVGGGAAAAFEALRHDYYVQKRQEEIKKQQNQAGPQGQQQYVEPSAPPVAAVPPPAVNPRQ